MVRTAHVQGDRRPRLSVQELQYPGRMHAALSRRGSRREPQYARMGAELVLLVYQLGAGTYRRLMFDEIGLVRGKRDPGYRARDRDTRPGGIRSRPDCDIDRN